MPVPLIARLACSALVEPVPVENTLLAGVAKNQRRYADGTGRRQAPSKPPVCVRMKGIGEVKAPSGTTANARTWGLLEVVP